MSDRLRVVYWNNIPNPYLVGRLNQVCVRGNIDVEVWFNTETEHDRSWTLNPDEWRFNARLIPPSTFMGRVAHLPIPELDFTRPDLLISLFGDASFGLGSAIAKSRADRHAYRVLPTYDSWVQRSWFKDSARRLLFNAIDGAKVPGPAGREYAVRFGIPSSRTFVVTQSIDVPHFNSARAVSPERRQALRQRAGLNGCVFLYVGRLWRGKGLDTLFDAFERVLDGAPNSSLFLVGDGVDGNSLRHRARNIRNVVFGGFVQPYDLPEIYAMADVLVFPTLGDPHGLVVEEAMVAGLPVISSEAAGDIRGRLPDGEAGYVVQPNNAIQLADRMTHLALDPQERRRLAEYAESAALHRSHTQYAEDFEAFVEFMLTNRSRKGIAPITMRAIGFGIGQLIPSRELAPLITAGMSR